jgi:hypothetical protein
MSCGGACGAGLRYGLTRVGLSEGVSFFGHVTARWVIEGELTCVLSTQYYRGKQ